MTSFNMVRSDGKRGETPGGAGAVPGGWRRPALLPTLAVLVLVPLFISFGQWQWNKAQAKGDLQAELDTRSADTPIELAVTPVDAGQLRHRRVSAHGHYETQGEILVDNRLHRGQAGYHVLTPLRIEGSEMRVLVNRGWIPAPAEHRETPRIETPGGLQAVQGIAVLPSERFFTLGDPEPLALPRAARTAAPPVWQNPDLAAYRRLADFPVQPLILRLEPESAGGGFVREWPRPDDRIQ